MGTSKDILIDKIYDLEEESERRRLAIENLLLQALENGKEIERLNKKIGELFKERDELYDGLQNL